MSSSMNLHDVTSIKIKEQVEVNGHAWRTIEITMLPICDAGDAGWKPIKQVLSIAVHCADERRPIDIEVQS